MYTITTTPPQIEYGIQISYKDISELEKELRTIVDHTSCNVLDTKLDELIPDEYLHANYKNEDVVNLSRKMGFIISTCMGYPLENEGKFIHRAYKANGVWVEPTEKKYNLKRYSNLSHGCCPSCMAEYERIIGHKMLKPKLN